MAAIHLSFNKETGSFLLGAAIAVAEAWGGPPLAASKWLGVIMIVDSGAAHCAVSDSLARRLGILVESLETEPTIGATGLEDRPVARSLFLELPLANLPPLRLEAVTVLHPRVEQALGAATLSRDVMPAAARRLAILGVDVAIRLGARMSLDYLTRKGILEW